MFVIVFLLEPFLDVIRCEEITGPVTSLALMSIYKFINFGLVKKCTMPLHNIFFIYIYYNSYF